MKWKQLMKKISGDRGYYLALAVCAAAVAVSGWLFVRSLREPVSEPKGQEAVQAAVLPTLSGGSKLEEPREAPAQSVKPNHPVSSLDPEPEDATEAQAPAQSAPKPVPALYPPLEGTVVQRYSMDKLAYNPTTRDWRTHAGVDIAAPEGSQVRAVAEGTVLSVYEDDLLGVTVTVEHAGGLVTHYANLAKEVAVAAGDRISAGQTLGTVSRTALGEIGSEPHLHFAVYKNNVPQDPTAYLDP